MKKGKSKVLVGIIVLTLVYVMCAVFACTPSEQTKPNITDEQVQTIIDGMLEFDTCDINTQYKPKFGGHEFVESEGLTLSWKVTYKSSSSDTSVNVPLSADSSYLFLADKAGTYLCKATFSYGDKKKDFTITITCVSLTPPTITSMPKAKAQEAGEVRQFATDLQEVIATDNDTSAENIIKRVTSIQYEKTAAETSVGFTQYLFSKVGAYTITVSVSDNSNNTASGVYTINVADNTAPNITILESYPCEVKLDDSGIDYFAVPTPTITDASEFETIISVKLGAEVIAHVDGKISEPKTGEYTVTYTVTDAYSHESVATTKCVVSYPAPTIAVADDMGLVWSNVEQTLPVPVITRLKTPVTTIRVKQSAEWTDCSAGTYIFATSGQYTVEYTTTGDYYPQGKHTPAGSVENMTLTKQIVIDVLPIGTINFETYNKGEITVENGNASSNVSLSTATGYFNGAKSLKFESTKVGWWNIATLSQAVPLPTNYDTIRFWIKADGKKPLGEVLVEITDSNNVYKTSESVVIDPLKGGFVAVKIGKLTDIKKIAISNWYGATGDTEVWDDELGQWVSKGETRSFYVDDISFTTMPTMTVAELSGVRYEKDDIALPVPVIGNYALDYNIAVSYTFNGGASVSVVDNKITSPAFGDYIVTYVFTADCYTLTKSIAFKVNEKKPSLAVENTLGAIYEHEDITLPIATPIFMADNQEITVKYKHSQDAEYTIVTNGIIPDATIGEYSVVYSAIFETKTYEKTLTIQVLKQFSAIDFMPINGSFTGAFKNTIGDPLKDVVAEIVGGKLVFGKGGNWSGVDFAKAYDMTGYNTIAIKIKAITKIDDVYFHIYNTDAYYSTEDNKADYDVLNLAAGVETTFYINVPSAINKLTGFSVLNKYCEFEILSIEFYKTVKTNMPSSLSYPERTLNLTTMMGTFDKYEIMTPGTTKYENLDSALAAAYLIPADILGAQQEVVYKFRATKKVDDTITINFLTVRIIEFKKSVDVVAPPEWATLTDGSVTLPTATAVNFIEADGAVTIAVAYKLKSSQTWIDTTNGGTISDLALGVYEVKYTATGANSGTAEKVLEFKIRELLNWDFEEYSGIINTPSTTPPSSLLKYENGTVIMTNKVKATPWASMVTAFAVNNCNKVEFRIKAVSENAVGNVILEVENTVFTTAITTEWKTVSFNFPQKSSSRIEVGFPTHMNEYTVAIDSIRFYQYTETKETQEKFINETIDLTTLFSAYDTLKVKLPSASEYVDVAKTATYAFTSVGAYEFTAKSAPGMQETSLTITVTVLALVPKITVEAPAEWANLYSGSVTLPTATVSNLDGATWAVSYKLKSSPTWLDTTNGATITGLAVGDYSVKFVASNATSNVESILEFRIREVGRIDFDTISGVTNGKTARYGCSVAGELEIKDYVAAWWTPYAVFGQKYETPVGANTLKIRIKASEARTVDIAWYSNEGGRVDSTNLAITTEYQEFEFNLGSVPNSNIIKFEIGNNTGAATAYTIDSIRFYQYTETKATQEKFINETIDLTTLFSAYDTLKVKLPSASEYVDVAKTATYAFTSVGAYEFTAKSAPGMQETSLTITVTVLALVPKITVEAPAEWANLYSGSVTLPTATVSNLDGATWAVSYKLKSSPTWLDTTNGGTITGLAVGDYSVKFVASNATSNAESILEFRIREVGKIDFDTISGVTNGKTARYGCSPAGELEIKDYVAAWWTPLAVFGQKYETPVGANTLKIRIKASEARTINIAWYSSEGGRVDSTNLAITTEYQELEFNLGSVPNSNILNFEIGNNTGAATAYTIDYIQFYVK